MMSVSQLLFGTDHPHYDVAGTVGNFAALELDPAVRHAILCDNPRRLLDRLSPR